MDSFITKNIILFLILFFLFNYLKELNENFKNNNLFKKYNNFLIKYLHKDPNIVLIKKFLTEEECNYIIKIGKPYIKRSEVCGSNGSLPNKNRTSMTAHIGKKFITKTKKDKVLMNVLKKASQFSKKPVKNIEHIQLVKYVKGQFFKPHYDYLDRNISYYKDNIEKNGQRQFTFFVYLTDIPNNVGGTTYFPKLKKHFRCNKGDSLFWSNMVNGKDDDRLLHGGTELLKGEKYGLNIWVREKEYLY